MNAIELIKKHIFVTFLFIIVSCGGGGSSVNSDQNQATNFITSSTNESCNIESINFEKCDLIHDDLDRYYYIYKSVNLNPNESIPVLFALHGYGSSAITHYSYTNYRSIADDNNLVVVYPQGSTSSGLNTHWNNGGWTSKSTAKDIEFIDTIINLLKEKINIDQTRIYSSGMSNGGYMSYHLACNLDNKFAAIVSVTGSMTTDTFDNCSPSHPTAIMQIHGMRDTVVPYFGSIGSKSIEDVMQYWSSYNGCDVEPEEHIEYNSQNNYVINTERYKNCVNNVSVKLILHSTLGHNWPRTSYHGFSASQEIWNFVSKYDLYGYRE